MKNQFEKPNVVGISKGLELKEKKEQREIDQIQKGIISLQETKEQYEEWKKIALEQGDKQSALLYEVESLENEMLIIDGEIICNDIEQRETQRWQQYFIHAMDVNRKKESVERLENIDSELEFISDYIESLLEEKSLSDENKQKIQEFQQRKNILEMERLSYSK
ncbi:MAG: hypothetical protein WCI36_00870 [bacterium]